MDMLSGVRAGWEWEQSLGTGLLPDVKLAGISLKLKGFLSFRAVDRLVYVAVVLSLIVHVVLLLGAFWLSSTEPERNILFVHFRQKIFRNQDQELATAEVNASAGVPVARIGGGQFPFLPVKDVTIKVPVGSVQTLETLRQVKERITGLWDREIPPAGGKVLARLLIASGGRVVSIEVDQLSGPPDLGAFVAEMLKQAGSFETAMETRDAPLLIECEFSVTIRE